MKTTIIDSKAISLNRNLKELWVYRYVVYEFIKKDIKVRYTQTFLGMIWAFINPLVSIVILSFVFSKIGNVDSRDISNILYTAVGYLAWQYFSSTVMESSRSLIQQLDLVKKTYIPKLVLPISKALSSLIEIFIGLIIIVVMFIIHGSSMDFHFLKLISLFIGLISLSLGLGLIVSSLTIRFRDFHHVIPLILRVFIFITPLSYSLSSVPSKYKFIVIYNPLSGYIDHIRSCFFQDYNAEYALFYSFVVSFTLLIFGLYYFNHVQRTVADLI